MYQLDRTDWEIIALLNKDGRMSSAEISRRLGSISARTVTNRIGALTEHDIINIRSIINPEAAGYSVLADVFIEVEPGNLRSLAEHLADFPQISYVACATGDPDVIISVRTRNIKELHNFVFEVLGKIPGVRHTQTYLLPLIIKENTTWLPTNVLDDRDDDTA